MDVVGIRELKAHLSRHLKRVRAGARLVVTDRGREVATIGPVETKAPTREQQTIQRLVAEGRAKWSGGKPRGAKGLRIDTGPTIASTVLDDRR